MLAGLLKLVNLRFQNLLQRFKQTTMKCLLIKQPFTYSSDIYQITQL